VTTLLIFGWLRSTANDQDAPPPQRRQQPDRFRSEHSQKPMLDKFPLGCPV
jgi:hypothetical protein